MAAAPLGVADADPLREVLSAECRVPSEGRGVHAGCWMLDAGCWMLDAGCWMLSAEWSRFVGSVSVCRSEWSRFATLGGFEAAKRDHSEVFGGRHPAKRDHSVNAGGASIAIVTVR
jgi:hypothetical protein